MKTLIKNVTVLTVNEDNEIVNNADVVIDGQIIAYAGPQKQWQEEFSQVIDGQRNMVMPGFVNAHCHAAMTLFRSYADDLPLMEWLEKKIFPAESRLQGEDVYWGTMLAIAEMLKSGTTTFADMYFFMDDVARAVEESGIRAVLSRGLTSSGNDGGEEGLRENEEFVKNWHGKAGGRITAMLGPHAPYTCSVPFLQKVLAVREKLDVPLQIHLAETHDEVEQIQAQYGVLPVKHLKNAGLLESPVLAAHCVHLSTEDMEILQEYDVRIAHNPGSNLKLGSGIAPVPELLQRGVTVGLGTDGAASNNNLDMLEEMRLAALLHKGACLDATVISVEEALAMATRESARAVFLPKTGMISPGKKADLLLIDLQKVHLTPRHNPASLLVYAAQPSDIKMVMVDGKILCRDGELLTMDEEKIVYHAEKRAKHLLAGI